jgi:hypothetical protein
MCSGDPVVGYRRRNRLAVGYPPYVCRYVSRPTVFGLLRSPKTRWSSRPSATLITQPPGSRLPTLRLPTRFGVQFKLVRFYYAQRRAGRPRSSPRRFAAIVGYRRRNRPAVGYPPYGMRNSEFGIRNLGSVSLIPNS